MSEAGLSASDEIVFRTDAAIEAGDPSTVNLCIGAIRSRRIEIDREYLMLQRAEIRATNFLVTGDPDVIPSVPERS